MVPGGGEGDGRGAAGGHGPRRKAHDSGPGRLPFSRFFSRRADLFAEFSEIFGGQPSRRGDRGTLGYGEWAVVIRECCDYDPDRYAAAGKWPLREALVSFAEKLKRKALEQYRVELLIFAVQSPWMKKGGKPPSPPEILNA